MLPLASTINKRGGKEVCLFTSCTCVSLCAENLIKCLHCHKHNHSDGWDKAINYHKCEISTQHMLRCGSVFVCVQV